MSVGVGSGRSRWMWGPCRGMRDPTDGKGKGSDGEVGGLPPQEKKFSLFSPVSSFLHSSSSAEIMQRTDSFRNPIWEPLLPCTLIPRGPQGGTLWACISPAKAPLTAVGASPMLLGSMRLPPRAKHVIRVAAFRKSWQKSLSTSQSLHFA